MPRPLRIHIPGGFYHVTLRGNHQQAIFRIDADRLRLNEIVAGALTQHHAQVHAYCWMTNHLHFLIRIGEPPLGDVMRQIASEYARSFQRKLQTTGHLFERRYHARVVDTERYLLRLLQYIHMNPVGAGTVHRMHDYQWSSHHAYSGRRCEPWLTTDYALGMLSDVRDDAIEAYLRLMESSEIGATYPLDESEATAVSTPRSQSSSCTAHCSLDDLINEACRRFDTTIEQLRSASRDVYLMQVRAWIGKRAMVGKIANLSQVARALGRDRTTLRHAMKRCPDEPE